MKHIIYDKLVYALEQLDYNNLQELLTELKEAEKKAAEANDDWLMKDEYDDLNNFLAWMKQNVKPVTTESDNMDLHRYDPIIYNDQIATGALEKIANPIVYLQKEAEKSGASLNGQAAIMLANDANWLRDIAKKALKEMELPF